MLTITRDNIINAIAIGANTLPALRNEFQCQVLGDRWGDLNLHLFHMNYDNVIHFADNDVHTITLTYGNPAR